MKKNRNIIITCSLILIVALSFLLFFGIKTNPKTSIDIAEFIFTIFTEIVLYAEIMFITNKENNTFTISGLTTITILYFIISCIFNVILKHIFQTLRGILVFDFSILLIYLSMVCMILIFKKGKKKMKQSEKWYTSVASIIIAFIVFFPLGFVFLYLRFKDEYGKYEADVKILITIGVTWVLLGVFFLYCTVTTPSTNNTVDANATTSQISNANETSNTNKIATNSTSSSEASNDFASNFVGMLIVFYIPGGILIYLGIRKHKKFESYKQYLDFIAMRKSVSIDSICRELGKDYKQVNKDIAEMVRYKIIDGYIDENNNFTTKEYNNAINNNMNNYTNNYNIQQVEAKKQTKIVKCPECGAKNVITVGETKECEYCGTKLS